MNAPISNTLILSSEQERRPLVCRTAACSTVLLIATLISVTAWWNVADKARILQAEQLAPDPPKGNVDSDLRLDDPYYNSLYFERYLIRAESRRRVRTAGRERVNELRTRTLTISNRARLAAVTCGALTLALAAAGYMLHRHHVARLRPVGFCRTCGYDICATPDRCPECGTEAAAATAA